MADPFERIPEPHEEQFVQLLLGGRSPDSIHSPPRTSDEPFVRQYQINGDIIHADLRGVSIRVTEGAVEETDSETNDATIAIGDISFRDGVDENIKKSIESIIAQCKKQIFFSCAELESHLQSIYSHSLWEQLQKRVIRVPGHLINDKLKHVLDIELFYSEKSPQCISLHSRQKQPLDKHSTLFARAIREFTEKVNGMTFDKDSSYNEIVMYLRKKARFTFDHLY